MKAPAPIVAQAETEDVLPGIGKFVQQLTPAIIDARKGYAAARVSGWRVARAIYEFAARPDVKKQLKALNTTPDGKKRPGRPKTAHGLVMDSLAATGVVTRRTIEAWVYQWFSAADENRPAMGISALLKMDAACSEKEFREVLDKKLNRSTKEIEDLVARLDEQRAQFSSDQTEDLQPEEWARKAIQPLLKQFQQNGMPRAQSKARARALAERLNELLDPYGYAVGPKARQ